MKIALKEFFPVMIAVAGVIFAITIYFIGIKNTENGIYTDIGTGIPSTELDNISEVINVGTSETTEPILTYIGGVRTIGDVLDYTQLFSANDIDGNNVPIKGILSQDNSSDTLMLWITEIRDSEGNSVINKMYTEEVEIIEEIPAAFIIDLDTGELYINQSGIYTIFVTLFDDNGNQYPYEFSIPVEVR